ncbi:hypothetical protein ACJX0J_038408, partial [Zea mays]
MHLATHSGVVGWAIGGFRYQTFDPCHYSLPQKFKILYLQIMQWKKRATCALFPIAAVTSIYMYADSCCLYSSTFSFLYNVSIQPLFIYKSEISFVYILVYLNNILIKINLMWL